MLYEKIEKRNIVYKFRKSVFCVSEETIFLLMYEMLINKKIVALIKQIIVYLSL